MTDFVWQPATPADIAGVFEPLGIRWWIAGGVALDIYAGRTTRSHGDLDIVTLGADVHALTALRSEWDIHIAHDGKLRPWDGSVLPPAVHQFWVRPYDREEWSFEILLEMTEGGDWLYRRNAAIRRPVDSIGRIDPVGIPYLAPEICLLYKAPGIEIYPKNAADFDSIGPLLEPAARRWLQQALRRAYPDHSWIARLKAENSDG